jgi:DNA-binding transcriptional MocR family regulator
LLELMRQVERPGWINLGAGVPAPELLPVAALRRAFARANAAWGRGMWAYQRPEGHEGLRERVAARFAGRGARVGAEGVLLTTGCTQALHLALQVHAAPGDVVACESPCYYNLLEQIHRRGCRALPLPMAGAAGIDLGAAEALLRRHRPSCLVVCPTLSNPSAATMEDGAREGLVALCRQRGVRLVEDDIYSELHEAGAPRPLRAWDPEGRVVTVVTSFCKSVAPGLRVGAMLPGDGFEAAVRAKCMADLHSAVVAEATLAAFMEGGALERHLRGLRAVCRRRRQRVREAVAAYFPAGTVVEPPPGGFIVWVELPVRVDAVRLKAEAARRRVSFAPGELFLTGAARRTCLRLNCARAEEGDLERGVALLGEAVRAATSARHRAGRGS